MSHPSSPGTPPQQNPGAVVAEVIGDRLCTTCGFNLHGQQIIREPHYSLLMVRCPECATAAALQEYPSLGRWSGRLAFLAAAVFIMVLLGAFIGNSALFGAISSEFGRDAGLTVARAIAVEHKAFQTSQAKPGTTPTGPFGNQLSGWEYDYIDMKWWDTQDKTKFLAMTPSVWAQFNRDNIPEITAMSVAGLLAGVFWSVVLTGLGRSRLWLIVPMIAAVSSIFLLLFLAEDRATPRSSIAMAYNVARSILSGGPSWVVLAELMAMFITGVLIGRRLARLIVRLLLQPRHRGLLAFLWTCDGLPMPTTRRSAHPSTTAQ